MAIVTGVNPAVNGILANYYYDRATQEEVMMNAPSFLCAPTILAAMSGAGRRVAAITTKDKLRTMLARSLSGICFSVEKAARATVTESGIDRVCELVGRENPGIYDPQASPFCLEAGIALLQRDLTDFPYLSTTDFVQHKYAPCAPEALALYSQLDQLLGEIHAIGAVVGITADHGMNVKNREDGSPNVRYLEELLVEAGIGCRVILSITDPYVIHRGALGSAAMVYLDDADSLVRTERVLGETEGIEEILPRGEAAVRHELPPDRIGDLLVLGGPRHGAGAGAILSRSELRERRPAIPQRPSRGNRADDRQSPAELGARRAPAQWSGAQLRSLRHTLQRARLT